MYTYLRTYCLRHNTINTNLNDGENDYEDDSDEIKIPHTNHGYS